MRIVRFLCASALVLLGSQDLPRPDPVRSEIGYVPRAEAYITIPSMPRPIQPEDVMHWAKTLHLSDAQYRQFAADYAEYVKAELAIHEEVIQPLWDKSAELRSQFQAQPAPVHIAEQYARLFGADRTAAVARIIANEESLFDRVTETLADVQIASLGRVRAQRSRARDARQDCWYPAGSLDVTVLVNRLADAGVDMTPLNLEEYENALNAYDALATPLFASMSRAHVRDVRGRILIQSQAHAGVGDRQQLGQEQRRLTHTLVTLEKRIHDLNLRIVDDMAAALPWPSGRRLKDLFEQVAYPPVYPDPTDLRNWMDAVESLTTVEDARLDELRQQHAAANARREHLCQLMTKEFLAYRWDWGANGNDRFHAYSDSVRSLHQNRIDLALKTMRDTLALLSDEEHAHIKHETAAAEQAIHVPFNPDSRRQP